MKLFQPDYDENKMESFSFAKEPMMPIWKIFSWRAIKFGRNCSKEN